MGKAKAWDAARDQQLFLLIVDSMKIDYNIVAKKWAEKYPDDDSKPTASAIGQHINKLQKANGGGSGGAAKSRPAGVLKPSTPSSSKKIVPKTPTSSKRKNRSMSDEDEDDSEEDQKIDFTNIPKRESTVRRSKAARAYAEPESDADEDEDGILTSARPESRFVNPALTNTTGYVSPLSKRNSVDDGDEVTGTASRSVSKKPVSNFDYFHRAAAEDSDVSDYQPLV
ncbi:hypothetical protein M409DRAFT_16753 [Zasmidium cellare ATCC 36951]|uniref:Uncharacterized protein n=1 Tax=Zasmidium cellare ATCC 36951 TaxID=1080233 RepID=A0A6A6D3N0_ZASCE|nr:uncharacterized protein M409DRAFT_16753 [Zasmidium cellare ATCC 36951]KAF2172792.1 hypothetical protein M409DRAFT_16753 [Zasmidium cellare ATCC 36951]